MLEIVLKNNENQKVLELNGDLDIFTSHLLEQKTKEIEMKNISFNMKKVNLLTSAGLRSLFLLAKKSYLSSKASPVIIDPSEAVLKILDASAIRYLFIIKSSKAS